MVKVSELINENNNSREKTKAPNVIGVEILKKNGINVDKLIKELVFNASVEFTAYYYFTLLRANCTGLEGE